MAVLVVAAPMLLPESRNPGEGRLDFLSVALSLAAILPIVYSLKALARTGFGEPAILTLGAGLAFGLVFVRRQQTMANPLLDLRLFRHRALTASLGILLLAAGVSGGVGFLFAQYLQLVAGLSPLRAAMWSLPDTAGMIVCSLLCPIVARRIRRRIGVVAAGDWRRTWRRRGAAPRHAPHR